MKRLRLLHLVANRWWTGNADPALDLARTLGGRGHAVWFGCVRGDVLESHVRASGLPLLDDVSLAPTTRPWRILADVAALGRFVRRERIDIVHAHQTHDHWLAALATRGTAVRLVRTVHHRRAARHGRIARWVFRRTDAVLASSEAIAERLRAGLAANRPVTVVPGAVDVHRFTPDVDPGAVRAELGLGAAPVAGCVARMVPGRGHDVLLRAAVLLRARRPEARIVLVGRGDIQAELEREVDRLGLRDTVRFAGYRGADLPAVLTMLDALVFLGSGSEESCRAVLEAMAAGRPVVAARVGAVPETVVDGETGWLVEAEPEAVAGRLERLLSDRELARRMGRAGRRRAETLFTPERRADRVEAIYADLGSVVGR